MKKKTVLVCMLLIVSISVWTSLKHYHKKKRQEIVQHILAMTEEVRAKRSVLQDHLDNATTDQEAEEIRGQINCLHIWYFQEFSSLINEMRKHDS